MLYCRAVELRINKNVDGFSFPSNDVTFSHVTFKVTLSSVPGV